MDELTDYAGECLRVQLIDMLDADIVRCKKYLSYYKPDDDNMPMAGEMKLLREGTIIWAEKFKGILQNIKIE